MAKHNLLGQWGEQLARDYLEGKGYFLRDQNFSARKQELDIVALSPDGTTLVFIEVKTRTDDQLLAPAMAVDRRKIRNLARAADNYMKQEALELDVRFDIVTIVGDTPQNARIEHIENAFNPLLI